MLTTPDDPRVPAAPWEAHPARWLAAIVESSDDAIVSKTLDGVIRTWNASAERIFGYTAQEIVGRSVLTLIPTQLHAEEKAILKRLARRERVEHFNTVRLRKDGTLVEVSLSVSPICDDDDHVLGAAKIARDISEANRLRQAERELSAKLQHESHAKSRFLATMSHELRTPLNAIGGYVDLLEVGVHGPLTDEQRADLQRVRINQQALLRLIQDVLDFAKLESGRLRFHLGPIPIDELLHNLEAFVAPLLSKKRIDYHFEPCGSGVLAYADRNKVEQVMLNLLSNALKFTPEGRIDVRCVTDAETVIIQVRDTGIGIPCDHHETIFEPFVQVEQHPARAVTGTGLGLAISRELARGMGGDVTVWSEPGKGSTFALVLPRASDQDRGVASDG